MARIRLDRRIGVVDGRRGHRPRRRAGRPILPLCRRQRRHHHAGPRTVRGEWDFLGAWAVQGEDGVAEFHTVYTQPGSIDAYRETGEFADGTVLVKEVRKAARGALTTGDVAWSGEEVLWFVMIKDQRDRFPGNSIWAKDWGWALFLAEDPATNTATDVEADCMACHEPARQTDWVYTQGYPALHDTTGPRPKRAAEANQAGRMR